MAFHRPAPAALLRCAAAAVLCVAFTVSPAAFGVAHAAQPAPAAGQQADFNGDGFDDLAVGASFEDLGGALDAGAVNVLYGSAAGLTGRGSQLFTRDSPGVRGNAQQADHFGDALAAGDFDADGFADLAIGILFDKAGGLNGGAVVVLSGSAAGLTGAGAQFWTQDSPGVPGASELQDAFGVSLATGDVDGDGIADLAVGAPQESLGAVADAGAVNLLFGSAAGLTGAGSQVFTQDSPGVPGTAEHDDLFGGALAADN